MAVMSKILIIDDEPQLRGLLARIISLEGYDVLQAENCASGLKILQRETPDVVLCDVKLPDGNGVDLVAKIKAAVPESEVILLTATYPTEYGLSRTARSIISPRETTITKSFRC